MIYRQFSPAFFGLRRTLRDFGFAIFDSGDTAEPMEETISEHLRYIQVYKSGTTILRMDETLLDDALLMREATGGDPELLAVDFWLREAFARLRERDEVPLTNGSGPPQ